MRDRTILTILAAIIALISARPYAGGWNDGSRLATVECLVDHHTFAIDDSIFVTVPPDCQPYDPGDPANRTGTFDKLFIRGHFYSDKSPVPAILMAAVYRFVQAAIGLSARESPQWFCWLMTVISSGVAYVLAVRSMHRIGRAVGLRREIILLWVISFAIGTIALTYSRTVNNHIMLLGIIGGLLAEMAVIEGTSRRFVRIGMLAGFGYTIDLGIGPVLFLGAVFWLAIRAGSLRAWVQFAIAALPWLVLHHALNYATAGTIGPANANPDYLNWPGSPFNPTNMTGHWQHRNLRDFVVYSLDLLFGQKGFIGHNQMLILALIATPFLLLRRMREKPELLCALFWSAGTFAAYAAASNNYSGQCVSVRWFVPLLAPGFFTLALLMRERPRFTVDFLILSAFATIWSLIAWLGGPWRKPPLTWFWIVFGSGTTCWCVYRVGIWCRGDNSIANSKFQDHQSPQSHRAMAAPNRESRDAEKVSPISQAIGE